MILIATAVAFACLMLSTLLFGEMMLALSATALIAADGGAVWHGVQTGDWPTAASVIVGSMAGLLAGAYGGVRAQRRQGSRQSRLG